MLGGALLALALLVPQAAVSQGNILALAPDLKIRLVGICDPMHRQARSWDSAGAWVSSADQKTVRGAAALEHVYPSEPGKLLRYLIFADPVNPRWLAFNDFSSKTIRTRARRGAGAKRMGRPSLQIYEVEIPKTAPSFDFEFLALASPGEPLFSIAENGPRSAGGFGFTVNCEDTPVVRIGPTINDRKEWPVTSYLVVLNAPKEFASTVFDLLDAGVADRERNPGRPASDDFPDMNMRHGEVSREMTSDGRLFVRLIAMVPGKRDPSRTLTVAAMLKLTGVFKRLPAVPRSRG